jgi:glycosyltransferase involved in cell wall biosynthesis
MCIRAAARSSVQFIVLEEWILRNLLAQLPQLEGKVVVLPHPVPLNEHPVKFSRGTPPYLVAFLGLTTPHKGFDDFLGLIQQAKNLGCRTMNFELIGRLHPRYDTPQVRALFQGQSRPQRLIRLDYVQRVQRCDFVYLNLSPSHYDFTASGVLVDAIAFQKPVLVGGPLIHDPSLNRYGPIGLYCDKDEVIAKLSEATDQTSSYRKWTKSLGMLGKQRTFSSLAHHLIYWCNHHSRA